MCEKQWKYLSHKYKFIFSQMNSGLECRHTHAHTYFVNNINRNAYGRVPSINIYLLMFGITIFVE